MKAKDTLSWVDDKMKEHRLPRPKKPKGRDPEFEFPDDPSKLNSSQLGKLMMRYTAFYGYAQYLYGMADSEYTLVDEDYRTKINQLGIAVREDLGRVSADVVEAEVLNRNKKEFAKLKERRRKLIAVRTQVEARLKIYERFYNALSRDLARREIESRTL
jgi:hypothetical protein